MGIGPEENRGEADKIPILPGLLDHARWNY